MSTIWVAKRRKRNKEQKQKTETKRINIYPLWSFVFIGMFHIVYYIFARKKNPYANEYKGVYTYTC